MEPDRTITGCIFSLGIAAMLEGRDSEVQILMLSFVCALGHGYIVSLEPVISRSSTATHNT